MTEQNLTHNLKHGINSGSTPVLMVIKTIDTDSLKLQQITLNLWLCIPRSH